MQYKKRKFLIIATPLGLQKQWQHVIILSVSYSMVWSHHPLNLSLKALDPIEGLRSAGLTWRGRTWEDRAKWRRLKGKRTLAQAGKTLRRRRYPFLWICTVSIINIGEYLLYLIFFPLPTYDSFKIFYICKYILQ